MEYLIYERRHANGATARIYRDDQGGGYRGTADPLVGAAPDDDGIAVWSSIQHPYWLQRVMAGVLDLPLEKVRIYAPDPGGAFGGKQHAKYEPLVAFLALRTERPCRLVLTLEETFQAVRRGASEVHVRTGFRHDGKP